LSRRSTGNVLRLREEIRRLEELLADRHELQDDQAYRYRARVQQLPASFLAGLFGWTERPFFEADPTSRPAAGRPGRGTRRPPEDPSGVTEPS
jgi:hypothetical protein